jgi:AraC family transcriptional regulator, regulatory protein of adaptative response / DNA-3-methyladenine glycosylase II
MELDHDTCYRVFQARDARFDGRLFIGVRTTGIYCRPICPARTPRQRNVDFYASAAAAQEAGFRPCLRCRPEVAPELAAWNGTSSTVARALRLIETGAFDEPDIDALADRLGIGARQLRRLFAKHVGASPSTVLQTRRVHLAKQLIQDTRMPMVHVAHASGFGSVRRFNETFKDLFGRPPSELRRAPSSTSNGDVQRGITLRLAYSPPYAWDTVLAFLGAQAIPGIEHVSATTYARSIAVGQTDQGVFALEPGRPGEVKLRVHCSRMDALPAIISRVRRMFDLGADPRTINAHLSADPILAPLVSSRPGLRVAGGWQGFELAVRAILGQQITVSAARGLAARLVTTSGRVLDASLRDLYPDVTHTFPSPVDLLDADLTQLGMPRSRGAALHSLACVAHEDPSLFGQRSTLQESVDTLRALPGIGEWTAQYIAMRELREPDAFPATDVGLLRAVEARVGRRLTPADLLARAARWRPWRAYAAAHLWASLHDATPITARPRSRSNGSSALAARR